MATISGNDKEMSKILVMAEALEKWNEVRGKNFSYYSIVSYRIGVKWSLHALTQNVDYKAFHSENNFAVTTVTLSHHLTYYVTVGLHEMLNVTAKRI